MLEKEQLKNEIIQAFKYVRDNPNNLLAEQCANKLGDMLAEAIDKFVKSGEVSFTAGQVTGQTVNPETSSPVPLTLGMASGGKVK